MSDAPRQEPSRAEPPVRDGGPVEGVRGNREVPATPAEDETQELDVDELARERDELVDALQRLQAEFANYKKRTAREQETFATHANERLVKALLPVLDDLGRALEAAEAHEEAKLEEGVQLVHRQLAETLAKQGLAEIETEGLFDPHVHEALLSQPSEAEEGAIVEVIQKGYRLGDRVLRPARVVVAAPKEPSDGGG